MTANREATVTVNSGHDAEVTVYLGNPDFCMIQQNILFDTGSSFIDPLPEHKRTFQLVLQRLNGAGGEQLLVVGHTDEVGPPSINNPLSERRARSALAVLNGATSEWETIFRTERSKWSAAKFRAMLTEVSGAAPSDDEIRRHREVTPAGQQIRATLFDQYFRKLLGDPTGVIPMSLMSPPTLGCGEQHTISRGNHRPSRRAEFFFVRQGASPRVDCGDYQSWHNLCINVPNIPIFGLNAYYVSIDGDDSTGDGTMLNPWLTIDHSLAEIARLRQPGQHAVLSVLPGHYACNVTLPSETTLVGFGLLGDLPEVFGNTDAPVVEIPAGTRNGFVERLKITEGRQSGIRIVRSSGITIRDCIISGNSAPRGGGIAVLDSSDVTVENNRIEHNRAGTGDSAVSHIVIETSLTWCRTVMGLSTFELQIGDGHGGGIYIENSVENLIPAQPIRIRNNEIKENTAILFGGGLAVDNHPGFTGEIKITGNEITCNQASHGDLSDLEHPAIRCEADDMSDPLLARIEQETSQIVASKVIRLLHGLGIESGLGGGIALRHVSPRTRLVDNRIGVRQEGNNSIATPNRARRGGGVECFVGAYPHLENNYISNNLASDDGGGIAIDQFDPFLPASQSTFLGFSQGRYFPRQPIRLVNNRICHNHCVEDGGGLYATGNVQLEISGNDTLIEGNRAGENGGGIRVSHATSLRARSAKIRQNHANTIRPSLAEELIFGPDREGGGGIAARNARITLEDCVLEQNISHEFAGGAVFCNSAFEGGFDRCGFVKNESRQFDDIMLNHYGFVERRYEFVNCRGSHNRATGDSGAGGFLYAVRVEGNEQLEVILRGVNTQIGPNTSEHDGGKDGNVVIDLSGRQTSGIPDDTVIIDDGVRDVPTGIAHSTSQSGTGSAVMVIHGDGSPNDFPTVFPYTNLPPRIDFVFPGSGPVGGGTVINIYGVGFLTGSTVDVDGTEATVISVDPIMMVAETPPGAAGMVPIQILRPDGQVGFMPDAFTYTASPTISRVEPRSGSPFGNTRVTIHGSDFRRGARVYFGDAEAEVTSVSSNTIQVVTPPGPAGARVDIRVENVENLDNQSATRQQAFQYRVSAPATRPTVFVVRGRIRRRPIRDTSIGISDGANILAQGVTNRRGRANLDLTNVPDGDYNLRVIPPHHTADPVGPAIASATPRPSEIWRMLEIRLTIRGGQVSNITHSNVTVSGSTVTISLQPVWIQSPHHRSRPAGTSILLIIVHHTGGTQAANAINWFLHPTSGVSAHYVIDTDGQVVKTVHESRRANHTGRAYWAGQSSINSSSVGIEIVNQSGPYTPQQYTALLDLLRRIRTAYPTIPANGIIGHSDIAITNPPYTAACPKRLGRKAGDPGLEFDWPRLEDAGLGLLVRAGPHPPTIYGGFFATVLDGRLRTGDNDANQRYGGVPRPSITTAVIEELQTDLSDIGYFCPVDGSFGQQTLWAVRMFQDHFFSGTRQRTDAAFRLGQVDRLTAEMILSVR